MCAIRYHLSSQLYHFGTPAQRSKFIPDKLNDSFRMAFGLTEMHHGSDATHMDTIAKPLTLPDGQQGYEINGNKKWQ